MKAAKARVIVRFRIFSQILFLLFFFFLLITAGNAESLSSKFPAFFFFIDPLILLFNFIATTPITTLFLFALIPMALVLPPTKKLLNQIHLGFLSFLAFALGFYFAFLIRNSSPYIIGPILLFSLIPLGSFVKSNRYLLNEIPFRVGLLLGIAITNTRLLITPVLLFALIPVALSLIFGRFFCGWVCPFGAVNHFFSWIFFRAKRKKQELVSRPPNKKLLNLKYLILIFLLFSALMNTHFIGWLDPFSLFTRSSAAVITPSVHYSIGYSLKEGAKDEGLMPKVIKPAYNFARENILKDKQRVSSQAVLLGLILFMILFANLFQHRFFCNYLCPLGALYGLIAKFGLHRLKVTKGCTACNLCSNNCTYNGSPFKDYSKSECMVCYNCVEDCPHDAVGVYFKNPALKKNRTALDLGRRKVAGSIAAGLFLGTVPRLASISNAKIRRFNRPPGSVGESEFLKRCIRCGECIQVCPTNFIQPALFQAGLEGLWTPILNAQAGFCTFECNKCTQVCPTNAIEKLTLEEKKKFKVGTAVIDKNRCYTYADGYNCAVCEEHCPVADKAIKYRKVKLWNYEGKYVEVNQIYVVFELCIGCGYCENVCPRTDSPGIVLTSEEEARKMDF